MPDTLSLINETVAHGRDWVAIIVGLAAWLPWVFVLAYKYLVKPKLKLTNFRRMLTITNSDNAPYITIALSLFSFRKAASMYKIKMELKNIETQEIRAFECYSFNDLAIRSIIGKNDSVRSINIYPFGGLVIEKGKPMISEFSFKDSDAIDRYESLFFEIEDKANFEQSKDGNFVPDGAWLKSLNQSFELKKHFKKNTSWTPGRFEITLSVFTFERKASYIFKFGGLLEQFKVDKLEEDNNKFVKWIESDDYYNQENRPIFNFANMNIDPIDNG